MRGVQSVSTWSAAQAGGATAAAVEFSDAEIPHRPDWTARKKQKWIRVFIHGNLQFHEIFNRCTDSGQDSYYGSSCTCQVRLFAVWRRRYTCQRQRRRVRERNFAAAERSVGNPGHPHYSLSR